MMNFLEQNPAYIVLAIVLIIWAGISALLFRTESKLKQANDKLADLAEITSQVNSRRSSEREA